MVTVPKCERKISEFGLEVELNKETVGLARPFRREPETILYSSMPICSGQARQSGLLFAAYEDCSDGEYMTGPNSQERRIE